MKKATLKDLIAKQLQKENNKDKTYEIPVKSMGKSLIFKRPSDELKLDLIDEIGDGKNIRNVIAVYKKLIYLTCDLLQNTELHEELGVVDPFDTVDKIFDLDDLMNIGEQLMDAMDTGSVGEDIKNS